MANKTLVCIPLAGRGTRMGENPLHKALLPINRRAILSLIIQKFPADFHFVFALGDRAEQIKDFLKAAHPTLSYSLVNVEKTQGPGSGPGRSVLECESLLQEPFYFVSCDTLWRDPLPQNTESWIGTAIVPQSEQANYCNAIINGRTVVGFIDKNTPAVANTQVFTGLAYIAKPVAFFTALSNTQTNQELQISDGLKALPNLEAVQIVWQDVGTEALYKKEKAKAEAFDFSKVNECIFHEADRIIKFFNDPKIVRQKVARARLRPAVFPHIDFSGQQFFAYEYFPGKTLYEDFSLENLTKLLAWLKQNLWTQENAPDIKVRCHDFYLKKTQDRLKALHTRYTKEPSHIFGKETPSLSSLIERLPWQDLENGVASFIHGDLQPDNILVGQSFMLLDWRQDFAGALNYGDLYYDLAKLRGGLIIHYRKIQEADFEYKEENNNCSYRLPTFPQQEEALALLDKFIMEQGFDLKKVKLLNGLIFANMAPLHQAPFDKLLAAIARVTLSQELG